MNEWEISDRAELAHARVVGKYQDHQLQSLGTSRHEVDMMRDRAFNANLSIGTREAMTRYLEGLGNGVSVSATQQRMMSGRKSAL